MQRKGTIVSGKVAAASRKQKNENPLQLLGKPSSRFGSRTTIQPQRKRPTSSSSRMEKIFQQKKQEEIDIINGFFFYQLHSFNVAWSHLFIKICHALVKQAPTRYLHPNLKKVITTLLVKEKKKVTKKP